MMNDLPQLGEIMSTWQVVGRWVWHAEDVKEQIYKQVIVMYGKHNNKNMPGALWKCHGHLAQFWGGGRICRKAFLEKMIPLVEF
jgi:hypothetical protein